MTKKTKILLIILGCVILALSVEMVYLNLFKPKTALPAASENNTTEEKADGTKVKHVSDTGVTWIEPEKLDDLGLVKSINEDNKSSFTKADYYKVANLSSGGEIILALAEWDGPGGGPAILRFKKDIEGKYFYLINHSYEKDFSKATNFLASKVQLDSNTAYKSLSAPAFLTLKDTTLKLANNQAGLFSSLEDPVELGDTEYGMVYRTLANEEDIETGSIIINLKLADYSYVRYSIKPDFITDDEVAKITWSDGTENLDKYTSEGYAGCGSITSVNAILNSDNLNMRLKEAGKTSDGEKIYTVEANDPAMQAAYENYKIGRTKDILSIEEFAKKNPIFIYKSGIGVYVIYTGRNFAGLAECGKPVIYLYPENSTNVSVKVGANITISEPIYNGGWQVLAEPSGKLTIDGKEYDSLYWEGQGQEYPDIKEGTVVKKEEVELMLKNQLGELGLNEKEKADFLEFWLPKMPNTAYVRLTWFGTATMNKLAPLSVSPAPDTVIRIFLDFQGLNQSTNLPAQRLTSIPRKGFTLIEWGGLLRK